MIELSEVSLRFKQRLVLENVSLTVKNQKALAIIGPSGAGKSMLLKMMAGLVNPTSGVVKVSSEKISMLFQKNALFDSLTILNNLLLPLSETLGITGDAAVNKALQMLSSVGLEETGALYPNEISGGMQKRLGIARALIIEPEVILYDEPTAGLDPITSKAIAELMVSLHRLNQTTLVMVTNDLQRAYQVADELAFCDHQQVRMLGTPEATKASTAPEIQRFIYGINSR